MSTPQALVSFLVKAATAIARLDNTLGAHDDDESFRQLALGVLSDEAPIPDYFADLHDELVAGLDPVAALSQLFARQAASYTEAGARACSMVVDVALLHLARTSGDTAAQSFLDDLDAHAEAMEGE